jgi:hypothetical protein
MPDNAGVTGSSTDKPINALGLESDSGDSINAGGHGLSKSSSASSLSGTAPEMPVLEAFVERDRSFVERDRSFVERDRSFVEAPGWPSSPSSSATDPEMPDLRTISPSSSGRDPEMPGLASWESEEESQVLIHEMPQLSEWISESSLGNLYRRPELRPHERHRRPLMVRDVFFQSAAIGAAWVAAEAWMTVGSPLPQR